MPVILCLNSNISFGHAIRREMTILTPIIGCQVHFGSFNMHPEPPPSMLHTTLVAGLPALQALHLGPLWPRFLQPL